MPRTRHGTKGGTRSPQRRHRSPSEGGATPGATSPRPLRTKRRNDKSRSNSVSQAPSHHQSHILQQQHNGDGAAHPPSRQPVDVSTTITHHHQRVVPPPPVGGVMKMSPEAKLAWNLKILKRHDPLISRIYDQCPYGVLYTFAHAMKNMEFEAGKGRKYEGHWEKTNVEGTVFIIERSAFPYYGFFLLNRGGTSSIVQMFHENDTVEVGADTKFLTFRPGLWDRATTPYEEPFTRCAEKPKLICFWLSDEAAGPRFARFILRVKERLTWMAEHNDCAPPMTPLSQIGELSESDLSSEEDSPSLRYNTASNTKEKLIQIAGSSRKSIPTTTNATATAADRPLDKLFASLLPVPSADLANLSASLESRSGVNPASSETEHATSLAPTPSAQIPSAETTGKALLETLFPKVPVVTAVVDPVTLAPTPASATSTQPQPHSGLSLLDAIFASARASESSQPNIQVVNVNGPCASKSNGGQVEQNVDQPVTPPHRRRHEAQQEVVGVSAIDGDSSDGGALASDKNARDALANGVHYPPTRTNPPSRSRNHLMSKTSTPIPADVFDQPEAPSPSIIPNPYHTPKPAVLSRRQKAKAKFETMHRLREEGQKLPSDRTVVTSPSIAQGIKNHRGTQRQEGVLPTGNSGNQTTISREVATGALVSAYNAKHNERGPMSSLAPIGKLDFVNGILTLIHEETGFVDDLYNRYRASVLQQQQQQQ